MTTTADALGKPISVRVYGHHHDMTIVGLFQGRRDDGFILRPAIAYMAAPPDVPGPTITDLLTEVWIPRDSVIYIASAIKGETSLLDAARQGVAERERVEREQAQAGLVDLP